VRVAQCYCVHRSTQCEQTPSCRTITTNSMKSNSTPGALRRRGSTVSFTKMLASANKKDFPHDNRELDSDTDSDSDSDVDSDDVFSSPSPPRQTKIWPPSKRLPKKRKKHLLPYQSPSTSSQGTVGTLISRAILPATIGLEVSRTAILLAMQRQICKNALCWSTTVKTARRITLTGGP
jgi:hypothetical protein